MLLIVSFRVQFAGIGYRKSKNIGFSVPICYACLRAFIQLVKTQRSKGTHGHLRLLWDRVETMVVSHCVTANPHATRELCHEVKCCVRVRNQFAEVRFSSSPFNLLSILSL